MSQDPIVTALCELLGQGPEPPPLSVRVLETRVAGGISRTRVTYAPVDADEPVEALILQPRGVGGQRPGIVAIHPDGAERPFQQGKSVVAGLEDDPDLAYGAELCRRGYAVICPDRFPFETRALARSLYRQAYANLRVVARFGEQEADITEEMYRGCVANRLTLEGWSLIGREVHELRVAIEVLLRQPQVDGQRLGVIGHAEGGTLAILLAALDERIGVVCSSGGTFLYGQAFGRRRMRALGGFSGPVIPGLARWGDMDDILAALAPRPFFEAAALQGATPEEAETRYTKARDTYAAFGIPDRFETDLFAGEPGFPQDQRERAYAWFDRWLGAG